MKTTRAMAVLAALAGLTGCGKPSLEAACQKQTQVSCRRGFECARGFFEALFGTEQNCVTQGYKSCEAQRDVVCDDLSQFDRCLAETQQAACSTTNIPSCNNPFASSNCRSVSGRASCSNSNVNTSGSGCTVTLSQCTDNRVYTLVCSGSQCTCSDGSNQRTVNASCTDRASAIATCGWNVQ